MLSLLSEFAANVELEGRAERRDRCTLELAVTLRLAAIFLLSLCTDNIY